MPDPRNGKEREHFEGVVGITADRLHLTVAGEHACMPILNMLQQY